MGIYVGMTRHIYTHIHGKGAKRACFVCNKSEMKMQIRYFLTDFINRSFHFKDNIAHHLSVIYISLYITLCVVSWRRCNDLYGIS